MQSYQYMLWVLMMCLNTSIHRITSNISTRAKNPGHRAANAYGTSGRAENPCSQNANTCWSRRSHCGRHTRNQAMHTIETLTICKKTQSTDGLQPCGQQLNEQIKTYRQQPIFSGKSPNPFTQMNSCKHIIGPTIDEDTAEISRWKANKTNRKVNKTTLDGATEQRLVTTATPKNSLKVEAMRCMKNRAESAEEKRYTMQTLQQHQRIEHLVPQVQQSGAWRNRPCQKSYSLETQRYQNKNWNRIGNRKKERHTLAKAYLQATANTQTARPEQERDHHSNIKN